MDKETFKYNMNALIDSISADYNTVDEELRKGKYAERISSENTATALNYYQLSLAKRDPILPDPTQKDYENTAAAIQVRKDKLEADILEDIQKEFNEKDLIEKHLDAYFYDEPSKEKAREHLFHPARAAFNEKSEKTVSQVFVEQVSQKAREEKDQRLLQEFKDSVKQPEPSTKLEQDIQKEDIDFESSKKFEEKKEADFPGGNYFTEGASGYEPSIDKNISPDSPNNKNEGPDIDISD